MKNIIKIIVLLTFLQATAQRSPQLIVTFQQSNEPDFNWMPGTYLKDTQNISDDFVGDWVYNDNQGTILTFRLQRKNEFLCSAHSDKGYYFIDALLLTYRIVKNNVVIYDNLNSVLPNEILPYNGINENGVGYISVNTTNHLELSGTFSDYTYNQSALCYIEKVPVSAGHQPKLSLYMRNAFWRNDRSFYVGLPSPFSIPNNVVLTKI